MKPIHLALILPLAALGGCKTSTPTEADAAPSAKLTSKEAGAETRTGGSIVAAPARWTSLTSTAVLEAPPGPLTMRTIDDTVVAYNDALVARTYVAGETAPHAKLAPTGAVVAAKDVEGSLLLGTVDAKKIIAYRAKTLEPAFTTDVDAAQITSATANDTTAFVVIANNGTNELLSIEIASGKIGWRAPAVPSTRVRLAGTRLATGDDGHAGVLDPATGAKIWMEAMPGSRFVAADAHRVFTSGQRSASYDVATGKPGDQVTKINRIYTASAIDGDGFFGLTAGTAATRLFAIDLLHGAEGWTVSHSHPTIEAASAPVLMLGAPPASIYGEGLLVDDDAIYVETRDGIVHAYDRGDGKERASLPIFGGPGMAVLHAPDFALYIEGPGGVEILKSGTAKPEHAEIDALVTLDGKPFTKASVWYGVVPSFTDATGHAKGTLDGVGHVRIVAQGVAGTVAKKPCNIVVERGLRLDGKAKYTVELKATSCKPPPAPTPSH